tara:strand:- start:3575 stop:3823 length:249 start_codon:yes stop_codon:yes gene_type:complete
MKAQNKAGTFFSLTELENGNYLVFKLCSNSDSRVRGGISKTWRCDQPTVRMSHTDFQKMAREGMSKTEAEALYNKRLKGSQK